MMQRQSGKKEAKKPSVRQASKQTKTGERKKSGIKSYLKRLGGAILLHWRKWLVGTILVFVVPVFLDFYREAPIIGLRETTNGTTTDKLCLADNMFDTDCLPPIIPLDLISTYNDGELQSQYTLPSFYYRLKIQTLKFKNPWACWIPWPAKWKGHECSPPGKDFELVQVRKEKEEDIDVKEDNSVVRLLPKIRHGLKETTSVVLTWKKPVPEADNVGYVPQGSENYTSVHIRNSNDHHITYLAKVKLRLSTNTVYEIVSPELYTCRTLVIRSGDMKQSAIEAELPILITMERSGTISFDIEISQQPPKVLIHGPRLLTSIERLPTGEWKQFVGTLPSSYVRIDSIVPNIANNSVTVTAAPTWRTSPESMYNIWISYSAYGERLTAQRLWWNEQELLEGLKKNIVFSNVPLSTINDVYFEIKPSAGFLQPR